MTDQDVREILKSAIACHQAGRRRVAERLYRQVLSQAPRHPDALHMLGLLAHQVGQHEAAAELISLAIAQAPDHAASHSNLGNVLLALGRVDDAIAQFQQALAIDPHYSEAWNNLGNAFRAGDRQHEALESYRRAVVCNPASAYAHCNLGWALLQKKQLDEAQACLLEALALRPDLAEAHTNLGMVYEARGLPAEAIHSYQQVLDQCPDDAGAHSNLGNAYKLGGNFPEAVASYRHALSIKPDFPAAESNLGLALAALGRLGEARQAYDRALTLQSDLAEVRWNKAILLLLEGDYATGWREYESRWQAIRKHGGLVPEFRQPLWLGDQSVTGSTILLHHEQGLGDTLMTLRFVPLLAARGARVVLRMPPPLHRLAALVPGAAEVVAEGDPLPSFDMQCPMMSLPLAFRAALPDLPGKVPYLVAPDASQSGWRERLGPGRRPRIGLVWSGSTSQAFDQRPVPLAKMISLLARDADFFSLQVEYRPEDAAAMHADGRIRDCAAELRDLADTAGLIMQLDLVVTIDTAVAHLAGGLGKPTWVLLALAADYRWLLDRSDSPWYPNLRLFRQRRFGDWDPVLAELAAALDTFVPRIA